MTAPLTNEQREAIRARLEAAEGILTLKMDMPVAEIKRRQVAWSKIPRSAPWADITALLADNDRLRMEALAREPEPMPEDAKQPEVGTRDRLARRLCQEDNRHPDGHHDGCETICVHEGKDSVCPYLRDALAAIDVLMEPGDAALSESVASNVFGGVPPRGVNEERDYARTAWQAILTAIREGK